MKISIIGCGWYGTPLALELLKLGHTVLGTTRDHEKCQQLHDAGIKDFILDYPHLLAPELMESDLFILNIPPFENQLSWFQSWNLKTEAWVVFISSTSIYGDVSGEISEVSQIQENILAKEERWIQNHFSQWTILRFAGLLGQSRHPGKSLAGKRNLKGPLWPVNLLHLQDAMGFTMEVIKNKIQNEIFNVLSDEHHSRAEFYQEFARRMKLNGPEFDQTDKSQGKLISNEKMSAIYKLKVPKMIGRET
jgi:nucleoside-diphosphate-sugar epimerase